MISDREILEGEQRADRKKATGMYAVAAHYDRKTQTMFVTLKKGLTVSFPKMRSQVMANASDDDLSEVVVEGAGWYLIFPKLDDGLLVESLLMGRFGNDRWEREWAEKHPELQAA
jgi:hypothetical protein